MLNPILDEIASWFGYSPTSWCENYQKLYLDKSALNESLQRENVKRAQELDEARRAAADLRSQASDLTLKLAQRGGGSFFSEMINAQERAESLESKLVQERAKVREAPTLAMNAAESAEAITAAMHSVGISDANSTGFAEAKPGTLEKSKTEPPEAAHNARVFIPAAKTVGGLRGEIAELEAAYHDLAERSQAEKAHIKRQHELSRPLTQ